MGTEADILESISRLEGASRRARPLVAFGLLAIIVGFIVLTVVLNERADQLRHRANEAESQRISAEARADALEDILDQAKAAARARDIAKVQELLNVAETQNRQEVAAPRNTTDRPPQLPLRKIRVDVFYCQDAGASARALAKGVVALRPANSQREWRLRPLTEAKNDGPIYRVVQNEIRYNADEHDAAIAVQALVREKLGASVVNRFNTAPSSDYLTLFFCTGATPAQPATSPAGP